MPTRSRANLLNAFLLGLVHGITPDEHTWPITFSYAIGSYSTWRGIARRADLFAAFAAQQALPASSPISAWRTGSPSKRSMTSSISSSES